MRVMAVVKSDAYGHGLLRSAAVFYEEGVRAFGVAEVEEGALLREAGLAGEIIVLLGVTPEVVADVIHYRLQPVVYDKEILADLSARAVKMNDVVGVHLKVDVGMGRFGVMPEDVSSLVEAIQSLPGIYLSGVMSHFPLADAPFSGKTVEQTELFSNIVARIGKLTGTVKVSHIANSAALMQNVATHFDMVRPGITLFGCYPGRVIAEHAGLDLKPAMSFKTRVLQVKEVPADCGISYGHTFVTARPSRLAVLPVGYNNGYLRKLSGRAAVLLGGQRASVCGTICMNVCLVDVTELPGVRPGDEAVLMGRQGGEEITADELAGWLDTINYEVLCLIGNLNRRVYI